MGEISGILFFLLGAMTIVELIDAHDGFELISSAIKTQEKRKLLWIISFIAFFLSALLDNLTTTIVLISLMSKLIQDKHEKFYFASMIVIAANAGGAWYGKRALEDRLVEEFDICNVIKDYVLDEDEIVEFVNHMIGYVTIQTGLRIPYFNPYDYRLLCIKA